MLRIDYQSVDFPPGAPVPNGYAMLDTSWDEILWAALTVGRPNRQAVFQYGDPSLYEAIFRLSLVRMAFEQRGTRGSRLWRTDAARTLDPTEKGAVNYFIGMTMCKLFAARLLDAPWMLHLDVFRPALNPVLTGRSRPDLIGQRSSGEWIALECKGRISAPDSTAKQRAKDQASRCVSVQGAPVTLHIGGVSYLRSDVLQFYWRDPERGRGEPIEVPAQRDVWRYYYAPSLALAEGDIGSESAHALDLRIEIHPEILSFLKRGAWDAAKDWCREHADSFRKEGFRPDGIRVTAGESWLERFKDVGEQ
jgi:hypothetical protein